MITFVFQWVNITLFDSMCHHVIWMSCNLAAYEQPRSKISCTYKLVDAIRVYWSIHNGKES